MRLEAVDLACEPEFAFTRMRLGGMPAASPLPRTDGVALPARKEVPSFSTFMSRRKLAHNPPASFPRKTAVNIRGVRSIRFRQHRNVEEGLKSLRQICLVNQKADPAGACVENLDWRFPPSTRITPCAGVLSSRIRLNLRKWGGVLGNLHYPSRPCGKWGAIGKGE